MTIENLLLALALMKYGEAVGGYDCETYEECHDKAAKILGVKPLTSIIEEKKEWWNNEHIKPRSSKH